MGEYKRLKVYGNYILRASYPDIKIGTYFLISRFRDINGEDIKRDLAEIGSSIYIGTNRRYKANRDFRPFGIFNISYNNRNTLGLSFSTGFSKRVTREDIFNISFNYSKSINIFEESFYGISLNYLF